ncbi:fatty acid desaturase family protein [Mycobacteroides franklinii]|uniref:Stearoyl-CoA 9-desaturase n=1 Tax=Mycobacteroides franklinii TaxID=948102 RepID=A0A4R8R2H3_9MYCO|nr:fatty acid desaturase [Mycobacteroides franklinii]TDZ43200.1 Stearoyl-CoA 9-desaturase [Mycobacteroides franklinii]TDZ50335.1 Stearoyl-CoA 9-desaturase [Mycobacteroides franklinii]TDZ56755.1 Stearoyl-CoA 9-desaturase [Mycobacteroides franklinii]TDZ63696.1 Stearoyl-CoA 9-desaturase [Mycobacteroides franklinii]TDZ70093.1 Stearoyl-CoA 9-desaturase [Mycobacteroides franklinii]
MAISDIQEFAHLTEADVEALGHELDAIRRDVEESLGAADARYIRRTIAAQRTLELSGRVLLAASKKRSAWWAGAVTLGVAKIVENMEIGHNVMHGQWDWMNDPEIHSSSWEWDMVDPSSHWKQTHNYIHHKYTNVLGMDDDVGYGLLRITRDKKWTPFNLGNLVYNTLLMLLFEWGVGAQHLELGKVAQGRADKAEFHAKRNEALAKMGKQVAKDYVAYPALSALSPVGSYRKTVTANLLANVIRNIWSNAVIFCGHFPDGAEKFTKQDLKNETQGQWYLRQMLGSANFDAGPAMAFMSGNLCHQIEHHLFPDLPSNRLSAVSVRVRELCDKYDLPYTSGPFLVQYAKAWRTIAKLSLPDKYLTYTADNAPETRSVKMFDELEPRERRGLKSAFAAVRARRKGRRGATV